MRIIHLETSCPELGDMVIWEKGPQCISWTDSQNQLILIDVYFELPRTFLGMNTVVKKNFWT